MNCILDGIKDFFCVAKIKTNDTAATDITINKLALVNETSKFPNSIFGPIVLTSNCCIGFAIKLVLINHFG